METTSTPKPDHITFIRSEKTTATAGCSCGWRAFNGATLSPAGAERAVSIHAR